MRFYAYLASCVCSLIIGIGPSAYAHSCSAADPLVASDDPLPWPWGSECPFPWERITGSWHVQGEHAEDLFEFEVLGTTEYGSKILNIVRYSPEGLLVGRGRGVAASGQRIVRAVMQTVSSDPKEPQVSYWAIVRSYSPESETSICSTEGVYTVITLRAMGQSQSGDTNLILEKKD